MGVKMRNTRLLGVLAIALFVAGCSESHDGPAFYVTPEGPVEVPNDGSAQFCFGSEQAMKAPADVAMQFSKKKILTADFSQYTFKKSKSGFSRCVDLQCLGANGSNTVQITFSVISDDADIAGLEITREMTCLAAEGAQCSEGQIQCQNNTQYKKCEAGKWSQTLSTCGSETPLCAGTQCTKAQCSEGQILCQNDTQYKKCEAGKWSQTLSTCGSDTPLCDQNQCTKAQCSAGQIQCQNDTQYKTCEAGKWSQTLSTCGSGAPLCLGNACTLSQCSADQIQCQNNTQYKTCDGMKWSQTLTTCGPDKPLCLGNACVEAQCSEGEIQCQNDTQYKSCNAMRWSQSLSKCDSETPLCQGNACTEPQCSAGQILCQNDTQYQTCDGMKWSQTLTKCGDALPTCATDRCTVLQCYEGQILCEDDAQYRSCENGFWSQTLSTCGDDTPVCRENQCAAVAVCAPRCADTKIRRCDGDGVLGDPETCGAGKKCVDSNGVGDCVASDVAAIIVSPLELRIYEGTTGEFFLRLDTEPQSDVVIKLVMDSPEGGVEKFWMETEDGTVETDSLTFSPTDWVFTRTVVVRAYRDGLDDGERAFDIRLQVESDDPLYAELTPSPVHVTAVDTESPRQLDTGNTSVRFRAVAANLTSGMNGAWCTSGKNEDSCTGSGIRILKALAPDIIMIQEFRWERSTDTDEIAMQVVHEIVGDGFYVHRGRGTIPNGIISRYPIIDSGAWPSNMVTNRDWDWSIIDMPGAKELLVVSLHLYSSNAKEYPVLAQKLKQKLRDDRDRNLEYFLLIGGDFNRSAIDQADLKPLVDTSVTLPVDQNGKRETSADRSKVLDRVLTDVDLARHEVPVVIAGHSYPNGHVFDTRVYAEKGEIDQVPPALAEDSGALNMQHMAVIRDFEYTP